MTCILIMTKLLMLDVVSSNSFSNAIQKFIQCPYDESACVDNVECDSTAMGKRAGYFCNKWPFYSGGFAECCDENTEYYDCTHSVYSPQTNNVFCDFWYETEQRSESSLQLCDCKVNNGKYCVSWICASIENYDFYNRTRSDKMLSKLLLPNEIEIFGVHECGYFTDHSLTANNHLIKQWCYKYNDFKSCYCVPPEITSPDDTTTNFDDINYCQQWVCHQYLNNAKNDLSIDEDRSNPNYQNYWNISSEQLSDNDNISDAHINDSAIDMLQLSTKISHEEYTCSKVWSNRGDAGFNPHTMVDKTECVSWRGNLNFFTGTNRFSVMQCDASAWNPDASTFKQDLPLDGNLTYEDLIDTFANQWQCHEVGMPYRQNQLFVHFYLSTLIWSVLIGFISLFLIFCYMRYKYLTLSSFFCVQGWFFFIFGSIAAVHGGFVSFFIYFVLQFIIFAYITREQCKNRGKVPYGAVQRYDFDPVEESMSRVRDDDKL
eukprot:CAMPEP_0197038652 /NCGR_PEP_ID=MMETSP1384-20130603/15555_1 /TAXON_ID=29189 /ORGANISM="Ammonia sp." /LENGTH=487 /DNA_ID=CAMNT_0042469115 /DNA_START=38 /DNA_END=1501 /DNA_ORIENTATION=+